MSDSPTAWTFHPDAAPSMTQTIISIGVDLFIVFAVIFTIVVIGRRLHGIAKKMRTPPAH